MQRAKSTPKHQISRACAPIAITVCDAFPESLSWLGSVQGHRVHALGVEQFGQSGSIGELYQHFGLDVNTILRAAERVTGRPVRHRV